MPKGYGQYCPVSLATEILGERWTILVVMVVADGFGRFNDMLRALPRISPTLLSQRLKSLEDAGVLRKRAITNGPGHEYVLTDAGKDLAPIIMQLGQWGHMWARDLKEDDLDPRHLAWSIHMNLDTGAMPPGRTVIEFEFTGVPTDCRVFWIVVNDGKVDMCIHHPGFKTDLLVKSDLRRFVEAWRGFRSMNAEIASGRIRLDGPPALRRGLPSWLKGSMLAPFERKRPGRERTLYRKTHRTGQ